MKKLWEKASDNEASQAFHEREKLGKAPPFDPTKHKFKEMKFSALPVDNKPHFNIMSSSNELDHVAEVKEKAETLEKKWTWKKDMICEDHTY